VTGLVFKNNAKTTLSSAVNNSTTTIPVTEGSVFPACNLGSSGTFFFVTLDDDTNNEIVKVTVSSGSSGNQNLTVVRAQEGTSATAFDSGDKVELRMTAGMVDTFNLSGSDISLDSSNNRMGFGDTTPEVSLDLGSKTDSLHVPVGTTAQRPGSPEAGYLRYNSTTGKFEGYTNAWGDLADGSDFLVTNTFTTANASTTAFTISNAVQDEKQLLVFIDGVFQAHNSYSVSGTTVTLSTAPASGREVTIYSALSNLQGANMVKATMTGDNSDTTLNLGVTPVSENNVQVYFDGVYQNKDSFSISGQTLTFGVAPPTGVAVEAITHTILDVSAAASSVLIDEFTGDGSDVTFTLSAAPANENNTQVYVGGVYQEKSTYSVSGTTLTFSEAPANTVSIEVVSVAVGQINSAIQLSDADGDTLVQVEESADEDKIRFDTAGTERMIISGSNVGIGASSPNYPLTIHNSGDGIKFEISDLVDANYRIQVSGNDILTGPSTASDLIFQTGNSERMRIDSSGNVGIGITSPQGSFNKTGTLDVNGVIISRGALQAHQTNAVALENYNNVSRLRAYGANAGDGILAFNTGGGGGALDYERMRINNLGDILCGMTSASYLAAQDGIQIKKAGNIRIGGNGTAARNVMAFVNGTDGTPAQVGYIQTSGSGTAFGTTSDYRLKENVNYEFDALSRVAQLKPARFNFIADADKTVDGFLAHEVSDIVPEAISGTKDAVDDEGNPEYQGIDQSKLVPLLTKAIQELSTKVEQLEGKIE
jgi:hypothetical protein